MRTGFTALISGRLGTMCENPDSGQPELDISDVQTWPYYMTVEEVATVLRVGDRTVVRLIDTGALPAYAISTSVRRHNQRIKRADVLDLADLLSHPETPDQAAAD